MSGRANVFTTGVLASAVYLAGGWSFSAMAQSARPDFQSPTGWYSYSRDFIPPASGAGPVVVDPAHPHVTNDEFRSTGRQPTQAVADLNNPILQPWVREVLRKRNEVALSGKPALSRGASCWPGSITAFINSPMTNPMFFVQGPNVVVMIKTSGNEVRHVHLTDKHSANVKPSWSGESIGHYEGDTLVIDTIGMNDKTTVDGFGTPHTTQMHVIERFHRIDNGNELEVNIRVEDPGAFTMPWNAIQRYRQYEAAVRKVPIERLAQLASGEEGPLREVRCAENPNSFFPGIEALPVPQAKIADF
jgi:hypothetical protein